MARNKTARISIPKNIEENLHLAQKVYEKHQKDAKSSPFKALEDQDWDEIGPTIKVCLTKHEEAEKLKRQMEQAYAERDKLLPVIDAILRNSKALLKSIYSKNLKKLGEWGFDVHDTATMKKSS